MKYQTIKEPKGEHWRFIFSHEGASEKFCFLDPYVLFTLKVEDVEQHEFFYLDLRLNFFLDSSCWFLWETSTPTLMIVWVLLILSN